MSPEVGLGLELGFGFGLEVGLVKIGFRVRFRVSGVRFRVSVKMLGC